MSISSHFDGIDDMTPSPYDTLRNELATLKREHAQLRAAAELEATELLARIKHAEVQYRASLAVMTNAEFDGLVDRYQRLRDALRGES